jgi:L-alanine-DL-glutamate epimerase-like enolase superfamily enzyme
LAQGFTAVKVFIDPPFGYLKETDGARAPRVAEAPQSGTEACTATPEIDMIHFARATVGAETRLMLDAMGYQPQWPPNGAFDADGGAAPAWVAELHGACAELGVLWLEEPLNSTPGLHVCTGSNDGRSPRGVGCCGEWCESCTARMLRDC